MRIAVFTNDSYFSHLLGRAVFERHGSDIAVVVVSRRLTGSLKALRRIHQRTSRKYFVFRSFVQGLSVCAHAIAGNSICAAAQRSHVPVVKSRNVNSLVEHLRALGPLDLGIGLNLDQILGRGILDLFSEGVLNVHASKLPADPGISPALWAFARGDASVWCTIYRMDEGLDSGPVYDQFETPVLPEDGAFGVYARICATAGRRLADTVERIGRHHVQPAPQEPAAKQSPWSWPDGAHDRLMIRSGRRYLRFHDLSSVVSALRRTRGPNASLDLTS
jgi:methionyl-tRNA formyltransferase